MSGKESAASKTSKKDPAKKRQVTPSAKQEAFSWQGSSPMTAWQQAMAEPGKMRPVDVLALQRLGGNRAITQLLARRGNRQGASVNQSPNQTGLPDGLKSGIESLSGFSLDGVKVHYNSSQPDQLGALAYTRGSEIHVASGQEQHLPHEAWHVVQQAQGRVHPTMQLKDDVPVNDDQGLEHEADVMGQKAADLSHGGEIMDQSTRAPAGSETNRAGAANDSGVIQRVVVNHDGWQTDHEFIPKEKNALTPYGAILEHYGAQNLDLGKLKKLLGRTDIKNADIPERSVAKKTGGPSTSTGREGGVVETLVKRLGDSEKSLKGKAGNYPYAGGHLIAYNILEEASNDPANIAPQASSLNAPVYFNLFEKVGMGSAANVTIDVRLTYRQKEYRVSSLSLIRKNILHPSQINAPPVPIPSRIPYKWDATVSTEAESGLGATGSVTAGMGGLITPNQEKYDQYVVGRGKRTGYKVKVHSGLKDGENFTGGGAKSLSITAEQQDFPVTAPTPSKLVETPDKPKEQAPSKKQKLSPDEEPEPLPINEVEMGEAEEDIF